jgi:hypothetical protein
MGDIKVQLQNQYLMPPICCVCGAPAGTKKLNVGKSVGISGKTIVGLPFPLCDMCANAIEIVKKRRNKGCFTILGSIFLFFAATTITVVFKVSAGTLLNSLVYILVALSIFLFLGGLIYTLVAYRIGMDPEIHNIFKRASKAVSMVSYKKGLFRKGHIIFKFTNEQFAELFKQLNKDVVL